MPGKTDKLLIVCFSFPPFPGIGGRRWAKFAKHLAQSGYNIHTLSAQNESSQVSEWTNDVKHPNIITHTINLGLSKVLSFTPIAFFEKVTYKILWKISPVLIKGNPQDKLFFVKDKFLNAAREIIAKYSINTLIVSIPPYKLAYYLLPLKTEFPDLKLIVDYRDPWTDNKSYHGFHNLSESRLKEEIKYELDVLNKYDAILDVNEESIEVLRKKIASKNKFHHLPNGFDSEDHSVKPDMPVKNDDKIRFVYSGSFYPNLIYLLDPLLDCIKRIKERDPGLYSRLEFNFYGNMDHHALDLISRSGLSVVKYHGSVSHTRITEILTGSDYCLLFSAIDHASAFNTKFYEYLSLKKPIIYFGPVGKLSDYINSNNAGMTITSEALRSASSNELMNVINSSRQFNSDIDISDFDVKNTTKKLIEIINA